MTTTNPITATIYSTTEYRNTRHEIIKTEKVKETGYVTQMTKDHIEISTETDGSNTKMPRKDCDKVEIEWNRSKITWTKNKITMLNDRGKQWESLFLSHKAGREPRSDGIEKGRTYLIR